jgi:hypothetical protein
MGYQKKPGYIPENNGLLLLLLLLLRSLVVTALVASRE